jgi:ParB/RepB/Spo0J family partition protein
MDTAITKEPANHMAAPEIELVPISACQASPTNPRKRFDKDKLAELGDSIKLHGVLQPILVRPLREPELGVKYEIVVGERRWKASKLAGLSHLPVSIRRLTDVQVLELQLTENLQRDDLDPLEEADGYKQLMALKKINADQLAELLGKSRSYVYTRTKLNDLCPEARKALLEEKLDGSRALLIARIGHHDTQRQCLKDALSNRYSRGPMSYRELQEHIHEHYMLRIVDAPFDAKDPDLLPKAGPCTTCPKRSGNQPDLFGDVKRADVCTDPKCFDDKRQAHFGAARKDLEAQGHKVIAGDAAKKILPEWDEDNDYRSGRMENGYVSLDAQTYATGSSKKVSQILPADYKPVLIQHPATGKIIKAATQQAVAAAAGPKSTRGSSASSMAARPAKPKGPDVDEQLLDRLVRLMHDKAPEKFGRVWLRSLVDQVFQSCHVRGDHLRAVAKAFGWPAGAVSTSWYGGRLPKALVDKLDDRHLVLLMFDLVFLDRGFHDRQKVLALFGVKESAERDFVIAERKKASVAARVTKSKAFAAPKKAAKSTGKSKNK